MKKKLFLVALMIAIFACLLVTSINAGEFVSNFANATDANIEGAPDWANTSDTTSTAVLKIGDEYVRIPSYLIFSGTQFKNDGKNMDYDWISEKLQQSISGANLVSLEIPSYVTSISGKFSATNYPALEELIIPTSITSFPNFFLRENTVLKRIFIKQTKNGDVVQGITTISEYFSDKKSVLEYLVMELDYCTYIGQGAFSTSEIKEINFKGPFTAIKASAFSSCPSLEIVNLNNTSIDRVDIPQQVFMNSGKLSSVTLNNFSLGIHLFEKVNGAPGTLTFVATNVGSVGTNLFVNATNLKKAEISGPITSIGNGIFSGCSSLESAIIRVIGNTFSDQTSVGGVNSIVSKAIYEGDKDAYATGNHIIYGYTVCDLTYNGVHLEDNNPCVINCTRCGTTGVAEENPVHKEASVIEYTSYDKKGTITTTCQNEGCKHKAVTEAPALFEAIGYSVPEDIDKGGIVIGYIINYKAIDDYEKNTGMTLNYGVYAVAQKNLGENDIFDENGNVADGVVDAKVEKNAYVSFEFKIVGFNDDTKDEKLALGAYVAITKGETTEYSYIQLGTPAEGAKYAFTSYAEYLKSFS